MNSKASKRVQRYEWEDRLIQAETLGLLPAGAVNMSLRLASAIHWEPKGNKPSGLYWKNETALTAVNSSRATYFRHRGALFKLGFFVEEAGNLIPQLPDLSQVATAESHVDTANSHLETDESQVETDESQVDNPYTVDICTVDSCSDDSYSEVPDADAPGASQKSSLPENCDLTSGSLIKRFPGLFHNPGSLKHNPGGAAGESADPEREMAARRALALCEHPGTPTELSEKERDQAIKYMVDETWQPRFRKMDMDRARVARDAMTNSRELTW